MLFVSFVVKNSRRHHFRVFPRSSAAKKHSPNTPTLPPPHTTRTPLSVRDHCTTAHCPLFASFELQIPPKHHHLHSCYSCHSWLKTPDAITSASFRVLPRRKNTLPTDQPCLHPTLQEHRSPSLPPAPCPLPPAPCPLTPDHRRPARPRNASAINALRSQNASSHRALHFTLSRVFGSEECIS